MPIKFRCNYCRQFLGISRAQAGGVVDCPTCGRSIRVPMPDGTVQPLSDPEVNLEDAHLARALDELARLADKPVQKFVSPGSSRSESDLNEKEPQIPQPILEPIPIEVPLPPTPIPIDAPMNASLATSAKNGAFNESTLLSELSALASFPSDMASIGNVSNDQWSSNTKQRPPFSTGMIVLGVLLTFLAGMFTERFVRVLENLRRAQPTVKVDEKKQIVDNELTGRITYKTKEGESQPDRGARVLIFPQTRAGEVKLPAIGFRPADALADQLVANAALKALGGAAATANDAGVFRVPVEAGSYRLLVLSHYQPRGDAATDPALDKLLLEYFDKPEDVLGRVQHRFSPLRIKGTGDVWDHSF